jgi:TusA-related sulfurtransferase
MSEVVHLIIKKDYAASLIEHLQKEEAIEIVQEDAEDIPEWQKEAVRKTLLDVQQHPEQLQPWDIVKQKFKRP